MTTQLPDNSGPQTAKLKMTGASSFTIMSICSHSLDYTSYIHWDSYIAPGPGWIQGDYVACMDKTEPVPLCDEKVPLLKIYHL